MDMIRLGTAGLALPDGWEDRSQVIAVAPTTPAAVFRPNVVLTREPLAGRNFADWVSEHQMSLNDTFPGLTVFANDETGFGPHRGNLLEYGFTVEGTDYRQAQFMILKDGMISTVTYSNTAADYYGTWPVVESILTNSVFGAPAELDDSF